MKSSIQYTFHGHFLHISPSHKQRNKQKSPSQVILIYIYIYIREKTAWKRVNRDRQCLVKCSWKASLSKVIKIGSGLFFIEKQFFFFTPERGWGGIHIGYKFFIVLNSVSYRSKYIFPDVPFFPT